MRQNTWWPAVSGLLLLFASLALLARGQHPDRFAYALDDAYIHLAMARNVSQFGVWGVTRYAFAPASSSLLWTAVLALFHRLGATSELLPLWLNIGGAVGIVALLDRRLGDGRRLLGWPVYTLLLLLIALAIPLPPLIFMGMEHVWQAGLTLLFVTAVTRALVVVDISRPQTAMLLLLSALATAVRYEGLFLLASAVPLLWWRRRWSLGAGVLLAGLLPLALFGVYSVSQGGDWLPNSVLLKGTVPSLDRPVDLLWSVIRPLYAVFTSDRVDQLLPLLAILWFAALGFIARFERRGLWEEGQLTAVILVGVTLLHLMFARIGLRYGAYLVTLGVALLAGWGVELLAQRPAWRRISATNAPRLVAALFLVGITLLPLLLKGGLATYFVPAATTSIYEQHIQMGLFLAEHYEGKGVAANDIGAINYLADIRNVDLRGLGTTAVARRLQQRGLTASDLAQFARAGEVEIAVIYDAWFAGAIPAEWQRVGQWTLTRNAAAAEETVSFYAVTPTAAEPLTAHLRAFAPRLPDGVIQSGLYVTGAP